MHKQNFILAIGLILLPGCGKKDSPDSMNSFTKGTYAYDAAFLRKHTKKVIELTGEDGLSKVLLSVDYQGRVMTSTANGGNGTSYGWINYDLIASGEKKKQFNPVGGEERFWLGPEGGQFSLYFHAPDSFTIDNWQVPACIDTVVYDVMLSKGQEALFSKNVTFTNYGGAVFNILIERKISLLNKDELESKLNAELPEGVRFVGYESENKIQNTGANDWKKESGLLSIWLLGMMTPSENTVAIVPFVPHPNARDLIATNYFGEIPPERLTIKDSVLYFTCDGNYRSKIGLPPSIAKPIAASFDFQKNVLTVIQFPIDRNGDYVNSKWEMQKEPYRGDAVNSYNDGPLADGSQLGPFYELESSSPAMKLRKGEAGVYRQTTCHFEGDFESLNKLAKHLFGIDLNESGK